MNKTTSFPVYSEDKTNNLNNTEVNCDNNKTLDILDRKLDSVVCEYDSRIWINNVADKMLHKNMQQYASILSINGSIKNRIEKMERLQRLRNTVLILMASNIINFIIVILMVLHEYYNRTIVLVMCFMYLITMLRIKCTPEPNVSFWGNFTVFLIYINIFIGNIATGGVGQPSMVCILVIPAAALAVNEHHARIFWNLAAFSMLLFLYILHKINVCTIVPVANPEVLLLMYPAAISWVIICLYYHSSSTRFRLNQMNFILTALESKTKEEVETRQGMADFISRMSHEFRSPLHVVMNLNELALSDLPHIETVETHLKDSLNVIKSLKRLVSDVLTFARSEHVDIQLTPEPINVKDVINRLTSIEQKQLKSNVKVIGEVSGDIEWVLFDGVRLFQILYNLVSNAKKFTNDGFVKISAAYKSIQDLNTIINNHNHQMSICYFEDNKNTDDFLVFSVKDSGIGVTNEQMQSIFKPFVQADSSISRKYGGTGLGLSIVKKLVEAMKGCLWVKSEINRGFEFSFAVKCDKTVEPARRQISKCDKKISRSKSGLELLSKMHVLIIDDSKLNLKVSNLMLKKIGVSKVTTVDNGKDGIKLILDSLQSDNSSGDKVSIKYDLALIDLHMPETSGYEVANTVSKYMEEKNEWIPLIAFTADVNLSVHKDCQTAGFNSILTKPCQKIEIEELLFKTVPQLTGIKDWIVPYHD